MDCYQSRQCTTGVLLFLFATMVAGCQTKQPPHAAPVHSPAASGATMRAGYRLLYDLLGDEKNVSKLLIIKHERAELGTLIKEISATCGAAFKQLEAFVKADPQLDVKSEVLPAAERQTREQISKDRGKYLLKAKGKDLELNLLLTQVEALSYGSHLAQVLAQGESDSARQRFLLELASKLQALHGKVAGMLLSHYS